MKIFTFCFAICLIILSGCRVGPRYDPPVMDVPCDWKAQQSSPPSDISEVEFWWEIFHDPTLNELEAQALANSPNIFLAVEKIVEARALAGVSGADLFPQLNLNPSYSNSGSLFKIFLPPGLFGIVPKIEPFRIHQFQYILPLTVSYELDLWGKLQSRYDSALLNVEAQQEAFRTVLLTLTTDLASSYFLVRTLNSQIDILLNTIKAYQKAFDLNQDRFDKGVGNYIDVSSAALELSNAEALYQDALRQKALQEDRIALLVGFAPAQFDVEAASLYEPPPVIPPSLPSEVLIQRPDLSQAERTMASEHALIGAAYASFFPSFSLTGTLGFSSPDLKDFLTWKSRFWSMGANIGQNIFDGGRNLSNLELAWAHFREAYETYQQQVLVAFQEVEDALNNLEYQAKESKSYQQSVNFARKTLELSNSRYLRGVTNYLEVVVYENASLTAELNYIHSLSAQYQSTIQLVKALGGSWNRPSAICEAE